MENGELFLLDFPLREEDKRTRTPSPPAGTGCSSTTSRGKLCKNVCVNPSVPYCRIHMPHTFKFADDVKFIEECRRCNLSLTEFQHLSSVANHNHLKKCETCSSQSYPYHQTLIQKILNSSFNHDIINKRLEIVLKKRQLQIDPTELVYLVVNGRVSCENIEACIRIVMASSLRKTNFEWLCKAIHERQSFTFRTWEKLKNIICDDYSYGYHDNILDLLYRNLFESVCDQSFGIAHSCFVCRPTILKHLQPIIQESVPLPVDGGHHLLAREITQFCVSY